MRQTNEPFFNEFFFLVLPNVLQLFLSLSFESIEEGGEARVVLDAFVVVSATIFQKEDLAVELNFKHISTTFVIRRIDVTTQRIVIQHSCKC